MQDSIIIYRNPVEKAIWESAMNGGPVVEWIMAVFFVSVVFLVAFMIFNKLFASIFAWRFRNKFWYVPLVLSGLPSVFAFIWFGKHYYLF